MPAPAPGLPKTQVSGRAPTGSSSAVSQRNLKPLASREEKVVTPVRTGDVLLGRYRLEEKIGEGGMGSVYVAHDQDLDRHVAVKVLAANLVTDDEVVERFEREARLNAKLDHPNIAPVYDVGRHEGRPFIVMKLLEGDTLAGLLRAKGGLSSDETLKLMRQLAAGLDYIHGKGFIHRDIKAGNIFVGPTGHATILDFGILRPKSASQGLTRTGMVMGTPHYMAPEQAMGLRDVDHRVDIYALAVVLFECLTGTLPFEADSELRLIQLQAHAPPPDILQRAPWIAKPVAAVMLRALAKRPDDRFNSGAELVKALEAAYRDSGGHPASPPPKVTEGTAPGWRMKAGLLDALRQRDAADGGLASPAAALPGAGDGSRAATAAATAAGPSNAAPVDRGVASAGDGAVRPGSSGAFNAAAMASGPGANAGASVAGVIASGTGANGGTSPAGASSGPGANGGTSPAGASSGPGANGGTSAVGAAASGPGANAGASAGAEAGNPGATRGALVPLEDSSGSAPRSRRGVVGFAVGATLAVVLGLVFWKSVPTEDPRGKPPLAAVDAGAQQASRDAGAVVPLAAMPDAGAEAADAGEALAVADPPDAGADEPADAGAQVAIDKPAGKRSGRLNVVTTHEGEPWWAQVSIDGVPRGRTPLLLDLPVGRYQLRVERAGFRTEQREVKVASGKATVLRIDLVP